MKLQIKSVAAAVALIALSIVMTFFGRASAEDLSKPEEIEWTWNVRPTHADLKLPNVLLVGDSISRNYFPEVSRQLEGVANVYLMANSICIGDPRLPREIASFSKLEHVPLSVVHFNNGMHGWDYSEDEYRRGFDSYLAELRRIAPKAVFIWTTTTPVRRDATPGPTNARIDTRNAIAAIFTRGTAVDDQHALMARHTDLYEDSVHFNTQGANIEGVQAAETIRHALQQPKAAR